MSIYQIMRAIRMGKSMLNIDTPCFNTKKTGLDDFFASGGTVHKLRTLIKPELRPLRKDAIETNSRQLRDITDDALKAIIVSNNPPAIFYFGRNLARVIQIPSKEGNHILPEILNKEMLRGIMTRCSDWVSTSEKRGAVEVSPLQNVIEDILSLPPINGIPALHGIVTAPVFAADGSLSLVPGYQETSGLYYHAEPNLILPTMNATLDNIDKAKYLLDHELLINFPFKDDASRAHTIGMILLPFVRELIPGPTPLHLIDAPVMGTGKGLLADVCLMPFLSNKPAIITAPRTEEEWQKKLTSTLMEAPSTIFFDNVTSLKSAALDAALTAYNWKDRVLGISKNVEVPVRCIWLATSNNCDLGADTIRRTIWIRLDAGVERPYERTVFQHPNLREWVRENRGKLVGAILTLIIAWIKAGRPNYSGKIPLPGSYEQWANVIGGILENSGIPGFLENTKDAQTRLDTNGSAWTDFFTSWHSILD